MTEITTAITSLKRRKAPGDDSITNEHIIHSGKQLKTGILKLFNAIVDCCFIPDYWNRGLIVSLHKDSLQTCSFTVLFLQAVRKSNL